MPKRWEQFQHIYADLMVPKAALAPGEISIAKCGARFAPGEMSSASVGHFRFNNA